MTPVYALALAFHVLVAVLGIGLVGAIPLTARYARQGTGALEGTAALLRGLLVATQIGFVGMLVTGVTLDASVSGAFHRTGWFKASIAVLLVVGFSHARARAALRRGFAPDGTPKAALASVERFGWAMCAAVAVITVLMQMKPWP